MMLKRGAQVDKNEAVFAGWQASTNQQGVSGDSGNLSPVEGSAGAAAKTQIAAASVTATTSFSAEGDVAHKPAYSSLRGMEPRKVARRSQISSLDTAIAAARMGEVEGLGQPQATSSATDYFDNEEEGEEEQMPAEINKNPEDIELFRTLSTSFDLQLRAGNKEAPTILSELSSFASTCTMDRWQPMYRALGLLLVSRDHLLVVDQLQVGALRGQWTVVCDGLLNAGSQGKNSTTVVTLLVLHACRDISLPIREDLTHTVGFLELFAAITVAKRSLDLEARLQIQRSLVQAGDVFEVVFCSSPSLKGIKR
jgi:hypothetical protein